MYIYVICICKLCEVRSSSISINKSLERRENTQREERVLKNNEPRFPRINLWLMCQT